MNAVGRALGMILDHLFDTLPALILLSFLVMTSDPFVVTF